MIVCGIYIIMILSLQRNENIFEQNSKNLGRYAVSLTLWNFFIDIKQLF